MCVCLRVLYMHACMHAFVVVDVGRKCKNMIHKLQDIYGHIYIYIYISHANIHIYIFFYITRKYTPVIFTYECIIVICKRVCVLSTFACASILLSV